MTPPPEAAPALPRPPGRPPAQLRRREVADNLMVGLCVLALLIALVPLGAVLADLVRLGAAGLSLDFFTSLPGAPNDEGTGLANALVGTLLVVGIAAAISVPIGVGAGIYLSEYGDRALARHARFLAEVLTGLPSIIAGIVAFEVVVLSTGGFSALAGGVALSFLFVPVVAITTQEALALVPRGHREGALALGLGDAATTLGIVLPAAMGGVLTGIVLAVARVAGETAPLIFTAFDSDFWPSGPGERTATLSVRIYRYATSGQAGWVEQAWTGALVLVLAVLLTTLAARALWARRSRFLGGAVRG